MLNKNKKRRFSTNVGVPKVSDPALQKFLQDIAYNQANLGEIVQQFSGGGQAAGVDWSNVADNPFNSNTVLPRVTGLTASGAYRTITLTWNRLSNENFSYNAIFRADTDDFGLAVLIGTTSADVYTDSVGNNQTKYYWVRSISKAGVAGLVSLSATASTAIDQEYMLQQLQKAITELQLSSSIKLVDMTAKGYFAGIKGANSGTSSQLIFVADRTAFVSSVSAASETPKYLMVYQAVDVIDDFGNITIPKGLYMDSTFIKNGSITNAKIGNLAADKITSGVIAAERIGAGSITADKLGVTSLSAITATIGHLRTATSGARLELQDNLIQVFDEEGRTRIKIGVF